MAEWLEIAFVALGVGFAWGLADRARMAIVTKLTQRKPNETAITAVRSKVH